MESDFLNGMGFPFRVKNVLELEWSWLYNMVNVLNAIGLYTLKWSAW